MEYIRRLFKKEPEVTPNIDEICNEICVIVQTKAKEGRVFKNRFPLDYLFLDDRRPELIWDPEAPRITLHLLNNNVGLGRETDSFRIWRDMNGRWMAEYEDSDWKWKSLAGKDGVKKLEHLLKCVQEARVGKTYP